MVCRIMRDRQDICRVGLLSQSCLIGQPAAARQINPAGSSGTTLRAGSNKVATARAKIQTKMSRRA